MNILFLTTHLNSGGITSYLLTLVKGLIGKGHKVFLATSGGNKEDDFLALGARHLKMNIRTKSELDPRLYLAVLKLRKFIQENKIDVIHSQTRVTQVVGYLIGRMTHVSYVATCHGFFKRRFFRLLFPCWGEHVIAISLAVKNHLINDFSVSEQKIILVESGIDMGNFPVVTSEERRAAKQKFHLENNFTIGMIARLSDVKGQDVLIKAMPWVLKEIPQAKLCLFGEGREEKSLRVLVKESNLENVVLFFPVVDKIRDSLSTLDVFVMPSRQEGLGLSIMEAQAVGLPCVASRVGGIPSLIEEGKTGFLVEPENETALAKKLIEVFGNWNRCQEVGLAARAVVQKNHSAEKMVQETLNVYEKLLKEKNF